MKIALNLLILFFSIFPFVYTDENSNSVIMLGVLSVIGALFSIVFSLIYKQTKKENYKIASSASMLVCTPLILKFIFVSNATFGFYEDDTTPLLWFLIIFFLILYYVLTDCIKFFK